MGRRTVYARTYLDWRGRCGYCNVALHRCASFGSRKFKLPKGTVDHFIPRSKGGGNTRGNRVLACSTCNEGKGDIDPHDGDGSIIRWCDVATRLEEIASTPMVAVARVKVRLNADFPLEEAPAPLDRNALGLPESLRTERKFRFERRTE